MSLFGLPLATLGALFGGAALVTTVLYILKLRRRRVFVPFAPLWQRVLLDDDANQLFSQLKRWLSLALQLLLLALLVLALGDPRWGSKNDGRHILVLVDTSASMKSTDVAPSRLGAAKIQLLKLVQGLGAADRMLIAKMDAGVTPLSSMTADLGDLTEAVNRLEASDTRVDLRRGIDFAKDVLTGLERSEILLVSDGALDKNVLRSGELKDTKCSYLHIGHSSANVAVTAFSVRRYPLDKSRYELMIEVTNSNEVSATVELRLLGDGILVELTELTLEPGESDSRFYADLGGVSRTLEARVVARDPSLDYQPSDNHGYALLPERRRARVAVVTRGNTYLEAALLLDEYLDVTHVLPDAYPPAGAFDVTIFDGVAPPLDERGGSALYLNPPAEGGPVARGKALRDFGFDTWDRKSPLLRHMAPGNIQAASGYSLRPEPGDTAVATSDFGTFLVAGKRRGHDFVALGFDPRDSDFVLRVGWPLFLLNTIHYFSAEESDYLSAYKTGEVWHIPAAGDDEALQLVDPAGNQRTLPVRHGRAAYFGDRAGFYKLVTRGEGPKQAFAANLVDPVESDITPHAEITLGAARPVGISGFHDGARARVWIYLLLGVAALSLLEWISYHRRMTV